MEDSTVCFKMIYTIISFNPIPHMVVKFLLVPIHLQEKCKDMERKRGQTAAKKFQAQKKA